METSRRIILCALFITFLGCANVAKRPFACSEAMKDASYVNWMYWLIGITVQQGECAIFSPLKFESGQFYHYHKQNIDYEVATEKAIHGKETPEIDGFARSLNCEQKVYNLFATTITTRKTDVFGDKYDRSSREVTKATIRLIKDNADLKNSCAF